MLLCVHLLLHSPSTDPRTFLYFLALSSCEVPTDTHTQAWEAFCFSAGRLQKVSQRLKWKGIWMFLRQNLVVSILQEVLMLWRQPTTLIEKWYKISLSLSLPMLWPCRSNQPELAGKLSVLGKIVAPFCHLSSRAIHKHIVLLEQFCTWLQFGAINADSSGEGHMRRVVESWQ